MAPILGYWNLRGRAQTIRLILEVAGAEYEDKKYNIGPPPTIDVSEWRKDKLNLGLDFPNLPYYIDGDFKLTESHAIIRHLARKYNLTGRNEADLCRVEMFCAQVYDFHLENAYLAYNPDFLKLKDEYLEKMPEKLKPISDFLGVNKFVVGDYLTYADLVLFEFLEIHLLLCDSILKDFPTLKEHHQRINKLPAVEKYFNRSKDIRSVFYAPSAYLGGAYSQKMIDEGIIVDAKFRPVK